jgi:hypothetical protein
MRGFVGSKDYLSSCAEIMKKGLGLQVMYHYTEPTYERIGLTDTPSFLGCSAYLQACEQQSGKKTQASCMSLERRDLFSKFQERENRGQQPEKDETLYASDNETNLVSPLSEEVIEKRAPLKRSPPSSNHLQDSDSALSCSASQGSRYSSMSEESTSCDSTLVFQSESMEKSVRQGVSVVIQSKTQTPKVRSVSSHLRVETPRDPVLDKEKIVLK